MAFFPSHLATLLSQQHPNGALLDRHGLALRVLAPSRLCVKHFSVQHLHAKAHESRKENRKVRTLRADSVTARSIIQPQRSQNRLERILIRVVFVAGADGDHVEQLAVMQLRGYNVYDLPLAGSFVNVVQRDQQAISPIDRSALVTARRAQVVAALLQRVDEIIRCLLQVLIPRLRGAKVHCVSENRLPIRRTVGPVGRKPDSILIHLAPVVGHAHREGTFVVGAKSRRRIFDAAAWHRVWISGAISVGITRILVWIASRAALNLSHRLRAGITIQPFLNTAELAIVCSSGGVYAQGLRFLIYPSITICGTWMIAHEAATAAALLFKRAKNIGQVARIIAGIRHDASAKQIGFGFVLAAEFCEIYLERVLASLPSGRPTEDC